MNYEEALHYIKYEITPGSVYGLERVSELARRLSVPDNSSKIIHVAGTNGKGSTSRMIASILKEAGYKVGIFNSPFLVSPVEYLCINGENASQEVYADIISEIKEVICEWEQEEKKSGIEDFFCPTEFEISVCASLFYFKKNACDYVILECGLGGLTDATNFIPAPEVAVITNIGLDHTGFLGNTITEIASQKAGIIKSGSEVVVYPSCNEALNVFAMKAIEQKCRIYVVDTDLMSSRFISLTKELSLQGDFQKRNAAVAIKVIEIINAKHKHNDSNLMHGKAYPEVLDEAIVKGLKNVVWPGRFEIVKRNPYIIVDGGHNDQCIDALCASLKTFEINSAIFVVGVMADKTHKDMFNKLKPFVEYVITTEPDNPRRLSAEESLKEWKELGIPGEAVKHPSKAVERALELADDNKNIVFSGSLYMVGEVRRELLHTLEK